MIIRHLSYAMIVVSFLAGIAVSEISLAQPAPPQISKEYFVQQSPDEDLFIRINGVEAAFISAVSVQDGRELMRSGVPETRLVPVFQYINAPERNRQLDIRVSSNQYTNRSEFGLELTRLQAWDERSSTVSRAYSLLAFGMVQSESDSAADWTVKIDGLINAGRLFERFGMMEMRLWSNYLAAHQILYHLNDYSIVYSMTRDILSELKTARFQLIELATLQLQSVALNGLQRTSAFKTSSTDPNPIQTVLFRAASLARQMGYNYELAMALEASGNAYVSTAFYPEALEQFQKAVAIADSIADGELATRIRESIVKIHALQGDTQASSAVLKKIETQLQEKGSTDELALNLLEQGRLQISQYRYDQAIDNLYESLGYQNDNTIGQQVNFELAKAFYHSGRLDESIAHLRQAGFELTRAEQQRKYANINSAEAWWMLSNIYRSRGEYEQMRQARKAQAMHQRDKAQQLYDEGLDEAAVGGNQRRTAMTLFKQAFNRSSASDATQLQHLSRLGLCALAAPEEALCAKNDVKASYEKLVQSGQPADAAQAMYLWSQILVNDGKFSKAVTVLDTLIDEIHLMRHALPGVLGPWYHERHDQVFEYYLQLLSRLTNQRSREGDLSSLLVLSKIRLIEKQASGHLSGWFDSAEANRLRVQIAQRDLTESGSVQEELNTLINRGLGDIRKDFKKTFAYLSSSGLQTYMHDLSTNEAVLTYHVSPNTAQVWVMRKDGVQRRNIANPAYIYAALLEAQEGLANLGLASFNNKMDELGKRLVAPVSDLLTDTLYWVPAGPLMGFPFDALRLNSRYLLERHMLVNLTSFPKNNSPSKSVSSIDLESVFVAGFPQDYTGEYATSLRTSPEIETVADIFVGPGLNIVQGTALLPDEFSSEKFTQAKLIHLTMPGVIDLANPAQSGFELSGYEGGAGRASLKPFDIQSVKLEADLVFMSATRIREKPPSAFISQTGFVSDFIDAGSRAVIARVWVSGGGVSDSFIKDFYRRLEDGGNVADAFRESKRQYMKDDLKNGNYDWAGYQLFIK